MPPKPVLRVLCSAVLNVSGVDENTIFVHFSSLTAKKTVVVYVPAASPLCKDMHESRRYRGVAFEDLHITGFLTKISTVTDLEDIFPGYHIDYINSDVHAGHTAGEYLF